MDPIHSPNPAGSPVNRSMPVVAGTQDRTRAKIAYVASIMFGTFGVMLAVREIIHGLGGHKIELNVAFAMAAIAVVCYVASLVLNFKYDKAKLYLDQIQLTSDQKNVKTRLSQLTKGHEALHSQLKKTREREAITLKKEEEYLEKLEWLNEAKEKLEWDQKRFEASITHERALHLGQTVALNPSDYDLSLSPSENLKLNRPIPPVIFYLAGGIIKRSYADRFHNSSFFSCKTIQDRLKQEGVVNIRWEDEPYATPEAVDNLLCLLENRALPPIADTIKLLELRSTFNLISLYFIPVNYKLIFKALAKTSTHLGIRFAYNRFTIDLLTQMDAVEAHSEISPRLSTYLAKGKFWNLTPEVVVPYLRNTFSPQIDVQELIRGFAKYKKIDLSHDESLCELRLELVNYCDEESRLQLWELVSSGVEVELVTRINNVTRQDFDSDKKSDVPVY